MTTALSPFPPHAVSRLRAARLLRSTRPFLARGGPHGERCSGCRLILSHCLCHLRPIVPTRAGVCLLMAEHETLKPSNTGWLIADVVPDTMAFGWARTETDPALLALLTDPQWQPYVVFPGEFVAPERVVSQLMNDSGANNAAPESTGRRPLFILLDATWSEARKIFKKSPYLLPFPVLSLAPEQLSRYRLRRSKRDDHLCTQKSLPYVLVWRVKHWQRKHWMPIWMSSVTIICAQNNKLKSAGMMNCISDWKTSGQAVPSICNSSCLPARGRRYSHATGLAPAREYSAILVSLK